MMEKCSKALRKIESQSFEKRETKIIKVKFQPTLVLLVKRSALQVQYPKQQNNKSVSPPSSTSNSSCAFHHPHVCCCCVVRKFDVGERID